MFAKLTKQRPKNCDKTGQSNSSYLFVDSNMIGTCCLQPQNAKWTFYQYIIEMLDFITIQNKTMLHKNNNYN